MSYAIVSRMFMNKRVADGLSPAKRPFMCTSRNHGPDNDVLTFDEALKTEAPKIEVPKADSPYVTLEKFYTLNKDMAIVKTWMTDLRGDVNDLGKKLDRLAFFFVGVVLLKEGIDWYRDECEVTSLGSRVLPVRVGGRWDEGLQDIHISHAASCHLPRANSPRAILLVPSALSQSPHNEQGRDERTIAMNCTEKTVFDAGLRGACRLLGMPIEEEDDQIPRERIKGSERG
ncbi:hypothetical protein BDZ91DRAFT_811815 [Kalaharituber pfeilii]|nr:hypothetical protein BDZ91DRAFT_811815 [Kalaharituber pfeilii]